MRRARTDPNASLPVPAARTVPTVVPAQHEPAPAPVVGTLGPQQPFLAATFQGNQAWFDELAPSGVPLIAKSRNVSTLAPAVRVARKFGGKFAINPASGQPFSGVGRIKRIPISRANSAQLVF